MSISLETRNFSTPIQPDLGGAYNPDLSLLNDTIVIARPSERKTATVEPLKTSDTVVIPKADFTQELGKIRRIQAAFDRALGVAPDQVVARNYNPVLARAKYETLQTETEKTQFRESEAWQVETVLKERYHSARNTVTYTIDEEQKLRDQRFGNERCETVFLRGVVYRREEMKSLDCEREEKELEGFLKVQEKLTDPATAVGTKMVKISGPGLVSGTIYTDNFVDIYELVIEPQSGKKVVQMTRFSSGANYDQYREIVGRLKPGYFNEARGSADAYYLSHPIEIDSRVDARSRYEVFEQNFETRKDALKEEEMRQIIEEGRPRIAYLVQTLFAGEFIPENVAIAFNAVLKGAELMWKKLKGGIKEFMGRIASVVREMPVFKTIAEEVFWLGRQMVENVAAACGLSGSFSIGAGIKSVIGGITSFFGGSSRTESKFGTCKDCKMPSGDNHYHCPGCSRKFSDETQVAPEKRTKNCNCGFKFGC